MSLGLRGQEAKHGLGSSAVQAWIFFFMLLVIVQVLNNRLL